VASGAAESGDGLTGAFEPTGDACTFGVIEAKARVRAVYLLKRRGHPILRWTLRRPPALPFDESQEVGIDHISVNGKHAVRVPRIDLQSRFFDQLRLK
jgi:hypothetical protein